MCNLNREACGESEELDMCEKALLEKVIPRLLRPLEEDGRTVRPCLVHGDLWDGNMGVVEEEGEERAVVFDPSSFWGHNEYEMGNWRQRRHKIGKKYFEAYHEIIPKSEPVEDYDDRNALYCVRFNLHYTTLYPDQPNYREAVINDMKKLIEKFPEGYVESVESMESVEEGL